VEIRTSFGGLYRSMSQREEFRWMMMRIKRMAEPWLSAIHSLAAKQNLTKRRKKKVSSMNGTSH
ncbi:Alpha-1,6-mannosylglycoprotein 6-beta-N-acetylglucosaminyltransferase A, partial [Goodea atripinnis]